MKSYLRALLLLISGWCATTTAHAEIARQDAVYSGTIGKIAITFTIGLPDETGSIYGRYFYDSQCLDIPFEGIKKGNVLELYAGSFYRDNSEKERFELTAKGNTLKGTWLFKGKKLTVLLTRTTYNAQKDVFVANPFLKDSKLNDAYERIRISKASIVALDSVQTLTTGIEIRWYKEKHWDSYVFRITKGLPEATMKWANAYLENEQLMDFSNRGTCSFGESSEYGSSITDIFINDRFLAFNWFTDYFCGGAHPDFSSYQHNLDLKLLKELRTDDLIQFAETVPDASDFDSWSLYRSEVFAPSIIGMLAEEHPKEMQAVDMEDGSGCDYSGGDVWNFSSALITENGLWFSAYFFRAARMCDDPDWSVISYERLNDYLHPDYRDAFLSIGH